MRLNGRARAQSRLMEPLVVTESSSQGLSILLDSEIAKPCYQPGDNLSGITELAERLMKKWARHCKVVH